MKTPKLYLSISLVAAFAALLFSSAPARAQVTTVNAASFRKYPVAPGGLVSAFGTFTGATSQAATTLPLPTTLGGAGVTVSGVAAPLIFSSEGQINLQIPAVTPVGEVVTIAVSVGGIEVASGSLVAAVSDPAIFSLNPADPMLPGAIINADGSLNGPTNPARRGDTVLVFGTGIGAVDNTPADGNPPDGLSTGAATARAFFSSKEGTVSFSGLAPGFVGLWQLNITIPTDSFVSGPVPLLVTLGGRPSSNQVTIYVAQ